MGILDGKVAIVTGAGKGLGIGEAMALAKEGARVSLVARTFEDVVRTVKDIEAVGGTALALACDVRDGKQVKQAVAETVKAFGTVDILVNNAHIVPWEHPLEEWTEEQMREQFDSGYFGSWYFMMECFPLMRPKGGRIINFVSGAGHGSSGAGWVGYGASKEAIRSLTRTAAREWGKYRINVNAISPAAVSDSVLRNFGATAELRAQSLAKVGFVLPEIGDAELDIGRCVVFLAGPDSKVITGCTLSADAGYAML
jgi:NAD(P)-dependent dehydrogenase (short-subunit alcohol dehydrogenase family)